MEGILKVTPERLANAAAELGACGSAVRSITAEMTGIVAGLSSAWAGEDASAYTAKFNGLQDDMEKLHAMIQEHVSGLTEMAQVYSGAVSGNVTEIDGLSSDVIV